MSQQITVACLQLEALNLDQSEEALERALAMIDEAGQSQPNVMILPECTYPAYYLQSLETYHQAKLRPQDEVVGLFAERAKRHKTHLVVGLAQPAGSGRLLNSAYLYNPAGEVLGTYAKSFLWHFDQYWFDPGQQFPAYDLPFGRTGIFVCADGRMPEVVRSLGVAQARLLIDSTAWVTGGGDRATLMNPQFAYMIPVRAIENGAWIAVANKVGLEAESVLYCGRSCVVSPQGQHVAQASTDQEEVLLATIDLKTAPPLPVTRRPECYQILTEPTETLPIAKLLNEAVIPEETVVRLGAVQLRPQPTVEAFLQRASTLVETLVRQEAQLVLLPGIPHGMETSPIYQADTMLTPLQDLSCRLDCGLVFPLISSDEGQRRRSVYIVDQGEVIGLYHQIHLTPAGAAEFGAGDTLPVFDTRFGRLGVMLDDEAILPEVTRSFMLQGADLILWPTPGSAYPLRTIAQCRADENKVFVALATPLERDHPAQTALLNPAGSFMAAALPDVEQAIAGQMAWVLTRYKEMAPNTHVVLNRQPGVYRELI